MSKHVNRFGWGTMSGLNARVYDSTATRNRIRRWDKRAQRTTHTEVLIDETMDEIRREIDREWRYECDAEEELELQARSWWADSQYGVPAWEATADMVMVDGLPDSSEAS